MDDLVKVLKEKINSIKLREQTRIDDPKNLSLRGLDYEIIIKGYKFKVVNGSTDSFVGYLFGTEDPAIQYVCYDDKVEEELGYDRFVVYFEISLAKSTIEIVDIDVGGELR